MYKWQQVKALKAQGVPIKQIVKQMKLSKNTVRKYLRSTVPPCFKAREYKKLLEGYDEKVKGMLEKEYIGTRIYAELHKMGYTGSLSSVHRYISGIKGLDKIRTLATTRVETAPGKQMQYDWKEWTLVTDRMDLTAETIALIYCYRWQIELFFRWFKCILGCKHLLSLSENGVALQVYCALIACMLITLWTGRKPTKRTFEMFCYHFMGWADDEELSQHIEKLNENKRKSK